MTGKDVIEYIQDNHLEDAKVTVTATMYYNGDHDCRTTDEVSISEGSERMKVESEGKKPKYINVPTLDFYVDSELY
jgi:hypothetical protein